MPTTLLTLFSSSRLLGLLSFSFSMAVTASLSCIRLPLSPTNQHFPSHSLSLSSSFTLNPLQTHLQLRLQPFRSAQSTLPIIRMSMEAGVGVMATKLGMMSYFEPEGKVVPVTVVGFREGNIVTQVKTEATDGYSAVQVGYRRVRDRKLTKPEMGHLEKAGTIPMRHLQEFRLVSVDGFEPNQKLVFEELFKEGDLVDVSGITIGKGFQGLFLSLFLFMFLSLFGCWENWNLV